MVSFHQFGLILDKIIVYVEFIILIRVFSSLFIRDMNNPIFRFLYIITEPFLSPFRSIMPRSSLGLDFSPIIAYLFLEVLRAIIGWAG